MADNTQDMEMEDILSSIKNILEEDEHKQSATLKADHADVDIVNDVINSSSDDILELSPDMRIQEIEPINQNEQQDKTDDVDAVINTPSVSPLSLNVDNGAESSDTLSDDSSKISSNSTDVTTDISSLNIGSEDISSDSFFDGNHYDDTFPSIDDVLNETSNNIDISSDTSSPMSTDNDSSSSMISDLDNQDSEISIADNTSAITDTSVLSNQEMQLSDDNAASQDFVAEENNHMDETAVDASANIISNFAKMFSNQDAETQSNATVAEPIAEITSVGDSTKTLEEFVLDSITKVIGKEISHKWNDGADFETFAKEEIIRQTQAWINNNLPSLVEKVVKQEIERVIAKVGS